MFAPQNGILSASILYPSMSYPIESPIFGSYGDFSYTDSSPDASPTIARCWNGIEDEFGNGYEKNFLNIGKKKEENRCRVEQTRQNLERNLGLDLENEDDQTVLRNTRNLTTICEEGVNNTDNQQE